MPLVVEDLLTLPEHLILPHISVGFLYSNLVLCACFVDHRLTFCTFIFGLSVACSSSMYGFRLPFCYLYIPLRVTFYKYIAHAQLKEILKAYAQLCSMSYLWCLHSFAYRGFRHCVVLCFFFWGWFHLVCLESSVSLDCSCLVVPSVLSHVYFIRKEWPT